MKSQSVGINAIINITRYIILMLFPLITFPYITRTLTINGIGEVTYASSVVNYFVLLAGLGFSTYAIREGAKVRQNREKFEAFASEIFSMHIISTLVSYILLFSLIAITNYTRESVSIILILSLQIIFTTFGLDWVNTIYEDFLYITLRTIVFQLFSIIMLLIFVRAETDIVWYAIVTVISTVGANILNFFHVKRYCRVRFTWKISWNTHLKPVLLIFFSSIASVIYTNVDSTMLGITLGTYDVGIYSCALKIYRILKQVMVAYIFVFEPRFSCLAGKSDLDSKKTYWNLTFELFEQLLFIVIPLVLGTIMESRNIITILAGEKYLPAVYPLNFLAISIVFATFAYAIMHVIMLPLGYEKLLGICSMIGAVVDCILNYILINLWGYTGAAVATMLAECAVMGSALFFMHKKIGRVWRKNRPKSLIQIAIALSGIVCVKLLVETFVHDALLQIFVTVFLSIIVYFVLLYIMKNNVVYTILKEIKPKNSK